MRSGKNNNKLLQAELVAHGQLMTAFGAAAGQYFAAIGRLHALTEAVYGFATTAGRLVSPFHINFSKRAAVNSSKSKKERKDNALFQMPEEKLSLSGGGRKDTKMRKHGPRRHEDKNPRRPLPQTVQGCRPLPQAVQSCGPPLQAVQNCRPLLQAVLNCRPLAQVV